MKKNNSNIGKVQGGHNVPRKEQNVSKKGKTAGANIPKKSPKPDNEG